MSFTHFFRNPKTRECFLLVIATAIAFALTLSRQGQSIWHADFWAEDGAVFFASAFRHGSWNLLLSPYAGYYCLGQRILTAVVLLFPLADAPVAALLLSLFVQVLPIPLLLSSRMANVVPDLRLRFLLAFFCLAAPNAFELHGSLANTQWFIAQLAFLFLIVRAPKTRLGQTGEILALLIAGLSGPFSIFLTPLAAFLAYRQRSGWRAFQCLMLSLTAFAQVSLLIFSPVPGLRAPVADPSFFGAVQLFAGQVVLSALAGTAFYSKVVHSSWYLDIGVWLALVFGIISLAAGLKRGPDGLRTFILFAFLIFAAALAFPTTPWKQMITPYAATRYWLFPALSLIACWLMMIQRSSPNWQRVIGVLALCLCCTGMCFDWKFPDPRSARYRRQIQRYEKAKPGEEVRIKIRPPGWEMLLPRK